jgi:glycosyltransferase involved in cell wall biosynthesis
VVIPVYNRPLAARRAIDSVLAQTCQDFEIIVADDGSEAAVSTEVDGIGDPRIRLIRHAVNRGASAARNTGARAGTAPFIAFLDSDDEWLPTKLERQLEVFRRSTERLALVYTGSERVYADGSTTTFIPHRYDDLALALLTENAVGETSVGMVRRSAFDTIGGFDESLPSSQDLDLWLRICERFHADFVAEALVTVAKGSDRTRISVRSDGMTKGRVLFGLKHRDKLLQNGVLHRYLRDTGWMYQREARDGAAARQCYMQSLALRPTAALTYVLLASACLPMSWMDGVARLKHRLSASLRVSPNGWSPSRQPQPAPDPPRGTGGE